MKTIITLFGLLTPLFGFAESNLVDRIAQEKTVTIRNYFDLNEVKKASSILKGILEKPAVQNPTPGRLYKDKYVDNAYLLQDHNTNVFATFNTQYPHFETDFVALRENLKPIFSTETEFKTFFQAFLLLHDIGKPLGPLYEQHKNTAPIMSAYLQKWQFTAQQIQLADILINYDIIGDMAIAGLSIHKAQAMITRNAKTLNISHRALCMMHHLFWACDAGSYKSLKKYITKDKNEKYMPSASKRKIKALITWCNT